MTIFRTKSYFYKININAISFVILLSLGACTSSSSTIGEETQIPTPTIEPNKILNICVPDEPETLFIFGDGVRQDSAIFEAIYDGPYDTKNYDFQSVILKKIPSLAEGDAVLNQVQVVPGEMIVDELGNVVQFDLGTRFRPSGCKEDACLQIYADRNGRAVSIDQLSVRFVLLPSIKWSDGENLTAHDSVFSFEVAKGLDISLQPELISLTASYAAVDDLTIEWKGLPGYYDTSYAANFLTPLPQHMLAGIVVDEMLVSETTTRKPLGWGPYEIIEWVGGERLTLHKNPNYFRSTEGLPKFDELNFIFLGQDIGANVDDLQSGLCDVVDLSMIAKDEVNEWTTLQENGAAKLDFSNETFWEHLDFGIVPAAYDNGYSAYAGDRANYFGDARTRQAIAMCLDRQSVVNQLAYGQAAVLDTYVPSSHPQYFSNAKKYPYDPESGAALLEEIGWTLGADGIRVSQGILGIFDGEHLAVNYWLLDNPESEAIAQILGKSLAACGVKVNLASGNPEELFESGPEGSLFGRSFDLAQFSWPLQIEPACFLYFGDAIPGADRELFPYIWGGWNLTGWSNPDYDLACKTASLYLPGQPEYAENHQRAQEIFANQLPIIPLFVPQKMVASRPDMCGLIYEDGENALWNIEVFGYGEACQ